jgi:hypothetical protein
MTPIRTKVVSFRSYRADYSPMHHSRPWLLGQSLRSNRGLALCGTARLSQRDHRRQSLQIFARRDSEVDLVDRVVSSLPYLIPLFDGLKYGELLMCERCAYNRKEPTAFG